MDVRHAGPEVDGRRRAEAIARYDVVGRPARPELQGIVELIAQICRTPMATVNLISDSQQFHVAAHGIDPSVCRREDGMCHAVFEGPTPVVVPDCLEDLRFADHPFVSGENDRIRFYASHQLRTLDGVVIGTLCVYDREPRELDHEQVAALATLADRIIDVLELSLRSRELAASNERLVAFAGRVTHDLKSPLASVSMSLGLLREQLGSAEDPDEARWLLDRALRGSERMSSMIDQVLDHAATGGLSLVNVDLEQVLTTVLDDLGTMLTGVTLSRMPMPTVRGDEVQLRMVVQNLLDNALKYRRSDRALRLEISAVERPGGAWRIGLTDNGIGIPMEERERVFGAGVRLETRPDGVVPGSGIGLDTVRRVISDHGGRVGVEDGTEGGTTVWFELAGPVA